jgi:type II secretion system protein H
LTLHSRRRFHLFRQVEVFGLKSFSRGFSLIELMVVLAIIMVLTAIIVPTIGPMRRQGRMRIGAATVAESLRLARSMAIAQSAAYSVDSPDPYRFRVYPGSEAYVSPNPVLETRSLPEGVVLEMIAPPSVSFQPDGSCSGIVVVIRSLQPPIERRTIEAKAANGRVAVTGGSR